MKKRQLTVFSLTWYFDGDPPEFERETFYANFHAKHTPRKKVNGWEVKGETTDDPRYVADQFSDIFGRDVIYRHQVADAFNPANRIRRDLDGALNKARARWRRDRSKVVGYYLIDGVPEHDPTFDEQHVYDELKHVILKEFDSDIVRKNREIDELVAKRDAQIQNGVTVATTPKPVVKDITT